MDGTTESPTCDTPTLEAWADEIEPPEPERQTWRKTLIVAAAIVAAGLVLGSAVGVGFLLRSARTEPVSVPPGTAAQSGGTAEVGVSEEADPIAVPTAAPPSTVTVVAEPTTGAAPPPAASNFSDADQALLATLASRGWNIYDPALVVNNAHEVCRLFRTTRMGGDRVNREIAAQMGTTERDAWALTSAAMITYPNCA